VPRFDNPIEYQFAAEAAAAFGLAGRKLKRTLDTLRRYDSGVAALTHKPDEPARASLVGDAAEAFWEYVVLREQYGLVDSDYIATEYSVPDEVRLAMGPKRT
jgi:hypothetical protein